MKSANNKSHISTTGSFLESPVLLCGCALICPADARPVGTAFSTSHLSCFQSAGSSQTKRSPHGPTQYMRLDRVPKTWSGPVSNAGVCLCALVWPCRLAVMNMYAHANSRCPHPPDPVSRGLQRVHVPGRPSQAATYPPVPSACRPGRTGRRRTDATLPPQTGCTGEHTATIVVTCGAWNHISKQIAHGYTLSGIIFSFSHYIRVQLHQY